jgi:hypothetical protein
LPTRSFLVLGVVGQHSSRHTAAPTYKDVILGGAAAAACAAHKDASRGAVALASGIRGLARGARLDGTRRNRNAAACQPSQRQTGHSSRGGRTDAEGLLRLFRPSAYPRLRQTRRSSLPQAPGVLRVGRVAAGEESGGVADSGGLAPGGAAGRGRFGDTSAGPASAANGGRLAGSQHNSSGTAAVPAGIGGRSL